MVNSVIHQQPTAEWVPRSVACRIVGEGLGQSPLSVYRLMKLVAQGELQVRSVGHRHYVSLASIRRFLNPHDIWRSDDREAI